MESGDGKYGCCIKKHMLVQVKTAIDCVVVKEQ